ncbi:MAG TPA: response regulator [Candidatus Deferrimicrobiaceae bacterium]
MKGNPGVPMPKKLLLAEDSLTIQKVFELAFAHSDVSITAVDNGEDAVRLAGEIVPDLVVADVTLPGKDGYAVAAELRAAEKTRGIPVLILSGSLAPLDEQRFRTSRASGVLFKPFDSQELMGKVEGLLRREAEAPPAAGVVPAGQPPPDEHWDFSDVLEEVEAEAGKGGAADVPAAPLKREEILPGALLPGGGKAVGVSLNEFDVSVEEIGGMQAREERAAPPSTPEPHLEGTLMGDAPPAVTDLAPALEPDEGIEDIEELEEVEFPPETPPAGPAWIPPARTGPVAPVPEAVPAATAPEPPVPPAPESPPAPPADKGTALDTAFREQFSARAEEIFRAVATEAVEKVMWEMMDRLAADFSAKVRESVEAVAWEVIPATAEALIREEISRIRQQAGKLPS